MAGQRGFRVGADVGAEATLGDLKYVEVPVDATGTPLRVGEHAAGRSRSRLVAAAITLLGVACVAGLFLFDRSAAIAFAVALFGTLYAALPRLWRRRRAHEDGVVGLVVPARVLAVRPLLLGGQAQVTFAFSLYAAAHEVELRLPGKRAAALRAGDEAHLIVAAAPGQLVCHYEPEIAAEATSAALAEAERQAPSARLAEEVLPGTAATAGVVSASPEPAAHEVGIAARVELTPEEHAEAAAALAQTPLKPRGAAGRGGGPVDALTIILSVLVAVPVLLAMHGALPRALALTWWTERATDVPLGRAAAAVAVAGTVLFFGGLAIVRRRAGRELPGAESVELGPEGVRRTGDHHRVEASWAAFDRFLETPRLLVVVGGREALAIPKRALADGESGRLAARNLLSSRLPETGGIS